MTSSKPVPKLDLAPKLNRPLSLWNPLDYLRLLYWCFYFPQALRWYEENYGKEKGSAKQIKLWIQGLLLTVIVIFLLCKILEQIGFSIGWSGMTEDSPRGVVFMGALGMMLGGSLGTVSSKIASLGIGSSMGFGIAFGVGEGMIFGGAEGIVFSVILGVVSGMAFSMMPGIIVVSGMVFGMVFGVVSGMGLGIEKGVAEGAAYIVVFSVVIFRPENWLIALLPNLRSLQNGSWLFPRITFIPLPLLESRLKSWLKQDWLVGLKNAEELLKYSYQSIPVSNAVDLVLAETPLDHLIYRVSQLAEDPDNSELVKLVSVSGGEDPSLDTFPQATAAGFWYLHEKEPQRAIEAFTVVRELLYGEEMYILAHILTQFKAVRNHNDIANIELFNFPSHQKLRLKTWQVINNLYQVVKDIKLIQNDTSKAVRSLALNRAIGQLNTISNQSNIIPKAEQGLIVEIAENWIKILESIALFIGENSITKPIQNPYVIGDPVEGSLFVGREEIMRRLEELWVMSPQLQSVVIFGHRRMGKTSILRNLGHHLGADVTVVYINLQRLGSVSEGMGEVLMAITDGISDAVQIPPPADETLLKLPQRTFERYLKKVVEKMPQKGLIIALDEFEMIEELIEAKQIPTNFIGVLRSWVQLYSNVAFVFAGLHTLEEMTADYFNPLFGSVINIRVGFIEAAATRHLLTNPNNDFLLNYTGEALDLIYQLTSGQPYLVQLIGFLLVRRYNDQVFELGRSRDSTLTREDVEAVINHSEVFSQGRYYFTGVWQQAAEGCIGQQEILKALATNYQGLTINHLCEITGLDETIIKEALETLKRHDVVKETKEGWQIVVELFRRWVNEIGKK
ncbi:MAG: ATP-binding protein [Microcoleaceae cyanobacterium]